MTKNKIKDTIKFLTTFVLFLAITIPTYMYLSPSPVKEYITSLKSKKCSKAYQLCYRRDLSKMISQARPTDINLIYKLIDDLYQKDLNKSISNIEQSLSSLYYLENIVIFFNQMREIQITRDNITFLDIFFIKKAKQDLIEKHKEFKIKSQKIDFRSLPEDLIYRKEMSLKLLENLKLN